MNSTGSVAVILAAGKSTRMKSALPKVLHEVCGRPMVEYVLDAARAAGAKRLVVVVGHRADLVRETLAGQADVEFALQAEQKGTGHAVMVCRENLESHHGPVLVLAGDTPLLRGESLTMLLDQQRSHGAACVIGTAETANNKGLGRIVRDPQGNFVKIVEEKDATEAERRIQEINVGCYAFDCQSLLDALQKIRPENKQAEYYLTDCPAVMRAEGKTVVAAKTFNVAEAMGVNTRAQLAEVQQTIQETVLHRLMREGVTIVSPSQTWIDPRAQIGTDTVISPFTTILGPAVIGSDCRIGPHAVIDRARVADGSVIAPMRVVSAE